MIVSRSKGTSTTCHCEEAVPLPVIASQCAHWRGNPFPLCTGGFDGNAQKTQPLENGLPHQSADWFAMTVVVGTLAEPSYVSEINDHLPYNRTCGRGAQRMCVYHPKRVTHLPRALPARVRLNCTLLSENPITDGVTVGICRGFFAGRAPSQNLLRKFKNNSKSTH